MSDDEIDDDENNAFVQYAKRGMIEEIRDMVEQGHDPNMLDDEGNCALMMAYMHNEDNNIVDYLLDLPNINVNAVDDEGDPFIFYIIMHDEELILKVIRHESFEILNINTSGDSALIALCDSYIINMNVLQALLDRGRQDDGLNGRIFINMRNQLGLTALHQLAFARSRNGVEAARVLLEDPTIDPNIRSNMIPQSYQFERTPMHEAVINRQPRSLQMLELLINNPKVDVNSRDYHGKTPFLMIHPNIEVEKLALIITNNRIDITQTDSDNRGIFELLLFTQMNGVLSPQFNKIIYMILVVFLTNDAAIPRIVRQRGYGPIIDKYAELKDKPAFGKTSLIQDSDKSTDQAWSILYLHDYFQGFTNLHKWSVEYAKDIFALSDPSTAIDIAFQALKPKPQKRPKRKKSLPSFEQRKKSRKKVWQLMKQLKF